MLRTIRISFALLCAGLAASCMTPQKTAHVEDTDTRARAAESARPPIHEAAPPANKAPVAAKAPQSAMPDDAQIALTQPGDGSVHLDVRDGVLPQGAYRVGLTLADVCIDPVGTAEAAAKGGPEAMIPVLEIGALQVDGAGHSAFKGSPGMDAIVGADLGGTAILIVPAEGGIEAPPLAQSDNGPPAAPSVVCAVLDGGDVL